jgi:hypothetical protein
VSAADFGGPEVQAADGEGVAVAGADDARAAADGATAAPRRRFGVSLVSLETV